MYFCPCSCAKADAEGEEDVLICLPRNLSYSGESYLDRFSVSSAYVHNSKRERQLLQTDVEEHYRSNGAAARAEQLLLEQTLALQSESLQGHDRPELKLHQPCTSCAMADSLGEAMAMTLGSKGGPESANVSVENTMTLPPSPIISSSYPLMQLKVDRSVTPDERDHPHDYLNSLAVESPDSDLTSEEGIFVNMMDDLEVDDGVNGKSTISEASDDTCVSGDSLYYSPEEADCLEDDAARSDEVLSSLEEAVQQVASDLEAASPFADPEDSSGQAAVTTDLQITVDDLEDCSEQASAARSEQDLGDIIDDTPSIPSDDYSASCNIFDLLSPESPVYQDREFNFTRTELRKSTSLKSKKTPPGTPRRKKVVRFADAMGLDLESVRHILNLESPPKIPASAMADLQAGLRLDRKDMGTKHLMPCFEQPGCSDTFVQRVMRDKVCLENAVAITGTTITGVVRVANIAFHKNVRVRFTTNGWTTFHDITTSYVMGSNDGATDRFSFTIVPPPDMTVGSRLEFAVSFNANGCDYWDSNFGNNYVFECFAKTLPTEAENSWIHFL